MALKLLGSPAPLIGSPGKGHKVPWMASLEAAGKFLHSSAKTRVGSASSSRRYSLAHCGVNLNDRHAHTCLIIPAWLGKSCRFVLTAYHSVSLEGGRSACVSWGVLFNTEGTELSLDVKPKNIGKIQKQNQSFLGAKCEKRATELQAFSQVFVLKYRLLLPLGQEDDGIVTHRIRSFVLSCRRPGAFWKHWTVAFVHSLE